MRLAASKPAAVILTFHLTLHMSMPLLLLQEGVSIQELPVSSTASPAVSDAKLDAKHVASKPIKQEDGKGELAGPAVSNIPADALNRLIAMGGPAGERGYCACPSYLHLVFSVLAHPLV